MNQITSPQPLQTHRLGFHVRDTGSAEPRWVLRDLDLELAPGSQTVLTGPSGAGKSSLLQLLAGLSTPAEGEVCYGSDVLSRWPVAQREAWRRNHVGLVFQQFHLFAELSVLDNVLLPWSFDHLRQPPQARQQALELLDALGLQALAQARCGQLSRGEQQRVAVARALVRRPAVLLADEPTASLDPQHARATCALLQELCAARATTLVLATHDPALVQRFEQRIELLGHAAADRAEPAKSVAPLAAPTALPFAA